MARNNRRRNYFVDKRLQAMWALMNLIIAGIVGILIVMELMRSFYAESGWPLAGHPFALQNLGFTVKLIVLAVVGSFFIWILSTFASHRIAGPIFKLNQSMQQIINGNYNIRIKFRKKDFFQDIAGSFNVMTESIQKKFEQNRELLAQIKEKVNLLPQDNKKVQEIKKLLAG